jgi:hypothetical protein
MKISVIYPTRERPKQFIDTLTKWQFNAQQNYFIEWIISVDASDKYLSEIERSFQVSKSYFNQQGQPDNMKFIVSDNKTAIEAINKAAKIAAGDIFIVISDDFDCFYLWDSALKDVLKGKSDFVLKTDDEYQPTLVSLPIMDRIFYERYGYIYFPGYSHMFCDQELTAVAIMTGKYLKSNLKFPHHHYTTGKTPKDAINVKNDYTWQQGERLFNERLKNNFGITEPVMQYSEIKWR